MLAGDQTINISQFRSKVQAQEEGPEQKELLRFNKYVEQIKIKDDDYFNWDNPKIQTRKTILNEQKACLRRCEDLLKKMR